VASLAASAVLLVTFVVIEQRSQHALMPLRIFADRSRSAAFVVMLIVATVLFGVLFFLTIFMQVVLGYSALRSGLAFLPFAGTLAVVSGIVSNLIPRIGARPLVLAGAAVTAAGMYWFSCISAHATYAGSLLGPIVVTAAGVGAVFVPLSLVALNRVRDEDSGLAASLLNAGQQIGGAIGLAALGTVTWTVAANSLRGQAARAAAAARLGHAPKPGQLPASWYDNALAAGVSRGFLVAAGFALAMLAITALAIRVHGEDLAGGGTPARQRPVSGAALAGRER
jgi:MFS family permease